MKKAIYSLAALLLALTACEEEKELVIADHGPTQTIEYDANALMGSVVNFSVDLQDDIPLSTLKVSLLFDETVVADTTIRTKTTGKYEGYLKVPFEKDIPDGVASLKFVSQNIQFGTTEAVKDVNVSRPDFEYLTLLVNGTEHRMEKTGRNTYESAAIFSGETNATIVTAPIDKDGRKISFGFSGSLGISPAAKGLIPFSGVGSNYSVSFNTLTWKGSPFVEITLNGTQANMDTPTSFVAVLSIKKGDDITLEGAPFGIGEMELDPDFFTADGKFAAVDGIYKVTIQLDNKYFYVERMASQSDYATITSGAVWMIGEAGHYGKPVAFSAGWSPDKGGLCFAEVEPGIFQLTQVAGTQMTSLTSLNVKLFHQKAWGDEFGGGSYASVDSDLIVAGESDGNLHLAEGKKLEMGGIYRFTLDLTGGVSAAALKFEKIGQNEVEKESISFGGTEAEMTGTDVYSAMASLTQGQNVAITGIDDIADYWVDPDFLETVSAGNYKLVPVSGYYTAVINTAQKSVLVERTAENGDPIKLADDCTGAVWMIGDNCFGKPEIFSAGWNTGLGLCFAEVQPHVFQLTLVAGTQLKPGSMNVKIYSEKGWGGEFGGGSYASVESDLIFAGENDGNLHLNNGVTLEIGAPYRFTLDLTAGKSGAVLKFAKAGESTIVADKVAVNGIEASLVDTDIYASTLDIKKGAAVSITGVDGLADYWWEPDFFVDKKFNAVDGNYIITINKADKVILAEPSGNPNLEHGGLYLVGWGVARFKMGGGQPGWTPGNGVPVAQVSPGVYQFTGVAVTENDETVGGRFRTDWMGFKYLFQKDWGGETTKGLTFGGNAATNLSQASGGDLGVGSALEEGATYRLTVDFSEVSVSGSTIEGVEKVLFEKL